jgi:hypothetical protein
MGTNAEPPNEGASTSSVINSPILLSDSHQNLGPSLEAIVIADFTTAQLAATPTTTRVQDEFMTHAATLDNAITFPTPPSTDSFNAMILRALGDISGKFEAINQCLDGMPTTATMTLTIREEFTPRFVALETRITTTNERLDSMDTTTAAMLRNKFDPKFADLNERVGKTDELLMAKIDDWGSHIRHITKTAIPRVKGDVKKALFEACDTKISSIPDLEARVRVLENRPTVNHPPPNRPTPIDTSRVNNVPPAQRNPLPDNDAPILAEPPPADPRMQFDKDPAISVNERTRNTWANSPSGCAAGSQHKTPSQPANNPYNQPPSRYTPPRPPGIGANESQGQNRLRGGQLSLHARVTAKAKLGSLALADSISSNWPPLTTILALLGLQCLRMPSSSNVDTPTLPHQTSSRATTTSLQYNAKYVSFSITRLCILAARRSTV